MTIRLFVCAAATVLIACESSGSITPSSTPTMSSLQPSSGPVGTRVTISGTGFRDIGNTIKFGSSAYPNVAGQSERTIVFTIPEATNPPCRNVTPPCGIASALITPGAYDVSVTNDQGTSNTISFTVTSS